MSVSNLTPKKLIKSACAGAVTASFLYATTHVDIEKADLDNPAENAEFNHNIELALLGGGATGAALCGAYFMMLGRKERDLTP